VLLPPAPLDNANVHGARRCSRSSRSLCRNRRSSKALPCERS